MGIKNYKTFKRDGKMTENLNLSIPEASKEKCVTFLFASSVSKKKQRKHR